MSLSRRMMISSLGALPIFSLAAQEIAVPAPDGAPETIEPTDLAKTNVAILKRYMIALNAHDIPAAVAFFAPDTRNHGKIVGRPGLVRVLTELKTLFPDYRHESVEMTAVGDTVISRNKVSGTHRGKGSLPVEGGMLVGVEPTGKSFMVQHIHWWRFKDGLIVEHYAARDDMSMMQQLGLIPSKSG